MKEPNTLPARIWILTLSAFAIGTAEFLIAGILPQVAESLGVTTGQAGNLITAYALAIVFGGPLLTLWLARFEKRRVLLALMVLFVVANLIAAFSTDYVTLIVSRILAGLTQGPFYGIGAVVATRMVSDKMAGRAVGQMFAGLTLANVLGVPAGAWIGNAFDWHTTFLVVAGLGLLSMLAIALVIERQPRESATSISQQLAAFRSWNLLASLLFTVLGWAGFMTLYGYIAPLAEEVAGFERSAITGVLVVVGLGLVLGNNIGGHSADRNLRRSLLVWPLLTILALLLVGVVEHYTWPFLIATFLFGVATFANLPAMQMRVMKYGRQAPELAATANISAFNIANALGGVIGGAVVDSQLGPAALPFFAALVPALGLLFILTQERRGQPRALAC
ncbi:MFS transporter [Aeromonas dhakensis]|uniref:MFS transporter n=1 Tax=Aeromonas TaxID=642 RepID=UPI00191D5159|nr:MULTISPECIES: MFS transporter [Aeromonas]MDD9307389.1 MFS transporter [Aeromonas hydrophila]MBL0603966.1 MFS transporter [Aeromonas dhakensis]MBL0620625.1 MFS transporter [Aeromonas dhakensis]MBL0659413.1 MFS transporter [Aeromonas dhakensis]UCM52766.1 MFS transporter [Aeromonas dhakensis]